MIERARELKSQSVKLKLAKFMILQGLLVKSGHVTNASQLVASSWGSFRTYLFVLSFIARG